jgi:hypothetical protein
MVMGLAIRQHILKHSTGRRRSWGAAAALFAAVLSGVVFVGQIVGKWQEGGWVVLISFSVLSIGAHLLLIAPTGNRAPDQIHRIVVTKARVEGTMASIVEWQSLRMQEYRYQILSRAARFFDIFGVHSPIPSTIPMAPGDYDTAVYHEHPDDPSMLSRRLNHVQYTAPEESAAQETSQVEESGQNEPEVNKISQDNPEVEPTGQDVAGVNRSGEDTPAVENNGVSSELNGTEDDSEK